MLCKRCTFVFIFENVDKNRRMNMKYTIVFILLFMVAMNGQAQDKSCRADELRDMTFRKVMVAAPSRWSERASVKDDDTSSYDFCEANADGMMLYYNYVEQDYCELVAGPEKYTGVIRIPARAGVRQTPVVGVGSMAFYYCDGLTEVHLPNTMLYLESTSFYGSEDLQKVVLNENLIAIGWNAFEGCRNLSSINIPQSLEYIGYEAFYNCPKMITPLYNDKYFFYYPMLNYESEGKTYVIPDGIEVINEGAFIFTYLQEVVIPNSVKVISDYAFDGSHVQRVNIPNSVDRIGYHAFSQTRLDEVVVPASVKSFGEGMFCEVFWLKKAVLENPLDSIPFATFANCSMLEEMSYSTTVHKLGDHSFHGCSSLTHLPDLSNIDSLGVHVFDGCRALESVSLPASITYIPNNAFSMCESLKEVHLPESIESIGNMAFYQDTSLESIIIPKSVKTIGNQAFIFCKKLKNIDFSEGLLSIGEDAFSQLEQLETVSLPESIESIGRGAFAYGYKLKDVYVKWQEPLLLQNDIFDSYQHVLGMTLHVPAGTAERYASAPYWSNFKNIVEDANAINAVEDDGCFSHGSRPVKMLVDGKILILSKSSGTILTDGRLRIY